MRGLRSKFLMLSELCRAQMKLDFLSVRVCVSHQWSFTCISRLAVSVNIGLYEGHHEYIRSFDFTSFAASFFFFFNGLSKLLSNCQVKP